MLTILETWMTDYQGNFIHKDADEALSTILSYYISICWIVSSILFFLKYT